MGQFDTNLIESQVEARARLDSELTERAYAELAASVTSGRQAPPISVDDAEQLDGAVRYCLRKLGVEEGKAPANVTGRVERIDWICRPSSTMRRVVRLEGTWYRDAFGPMVAELDSGETVALIPSGVRGYHLVEPSSGRRVKVRASVAAHIEKEALLFYKPLPARPLNIRDLVGFILGVFDRYDYFLVLLTSLAATLIGLVPAMVNEAAFGTVIPAGHPGLIIPLAALLIGVAVSTIAINSCRNLIMDRVSTKLDVMFGAAVFSRLLSLPTSFFKNYSSGNLASRVEGITNLAQTLVTLMLGTELTAILSLAYVVQIWFIAPGLAMPAFLITLLEAILIAVVTYVISRYNHATLDASSELSGIVTALLNGVQKLKVAGAEDRAFAKWAHGYAHYARVAYNRPVVVRSLSALVTLMGLIGTIIIYHVAATTNVSVAGYMAFNVAYGQVTAAMLALARTANQISQIGPMMQLVMPILQAAPEVDEEKPGIERLTGGIEVSDVTFRYSSDTPYVLKGLSFKVRPGEYVAIVGRSGCGKSTILRLLLGFETPEQGNIFYGPHDVRKVDLRSLRSHIGVVMQDGKLILGDIQSNITISMPEATLDDAWEAAEVAGIADDIRAMPMGMQTIVTEAGGGISGGQRQRIMIARAICGHRRILLFDEATSALDNITQKHVTDSLAELKCTRIVIAHRLSTVKHCDRILVVDDGRISEQGTYEELLEKGGLFRELVERQMVGEVV